MLKKGAIIKPAHFSQKQFLSPIFLVPRKDSGQRPVSNLKKLNKNMSYAHFKTERLLLLKELPPENKYMCKKIPKRWLFFSAAKSRFAKAHKV